MMDITENGKYYIPSIEEFHVGFEYEVKETFTDGTVKTEKDFYEHEWVKRIADAGLMYIERSLRGRGVIGIRVKHLDQDDIIACGWESEENTGGIMREIGVKKYSLISEKMPLLFNDNNYILTVLAYPTLIEIASGGYQIFLGTIKNKSELQRIMRQVGIVI